VAITTEVCQDLCITLIVPDSVDNLSCDVDCNEIPLCRTWPKREIPSLVLLHERRYYPNFIDV